MPEPIVELKESNARDLGFGAAISSQPGARLVNHNGSFNVQRKRRQLPEVLNYATLLNLSWTRFMLLAMALFLGINFLFAAGYTLCGPGALRLAGVDPGVGRFARAFFFSVHTFSTIGYGNVIAVGFPANVLVVLEALSSLLSAALIAGLVFARFAKPNVRFEFSERSVLRLRDKPALLVRLRNTTRNEVLEVEATLMVWFLDRSKGGTRHFITLPVEREKINFLPLSWTVAHFITPDSPFYGMSEEEFRATLGEVLLQVRGVDQNSSQTVYARVSYTAEEMAWGARYADQYTHDPVTGVTGIDAERFHRTEPESGG